jgi:hypothetical protein
VRWPEGFQFGGAADPEQHSVPGRTSNRETFGHNGPNAVSAQCDIGWADPGEQTVLAYLSNTFDLRRGGSAACGELIDAVLAACR